MKSEPPMESVAPRPRELTGENSPHYTYQPTKNKTDRVLAKYFSPSTCLGETNAHCLANKLSPKEMPLTEGTD